MQAINLADVLAGHYVILCLANQNGTKEMEI